MPISFPYRTAILWAALQIAGSGVDRCFLLLLLLFFFFFFFSFRRNSFSIVFFCFVSLTSQTDFRKNRARQEPLICGAGWLRIARASLRMTSFPGSLSPLPPLSLRRERQGRQRRERTRERGCKDEISIKL